jgi:hypothetical protein
MRGLPRGVRTPRSGAPVTSREARVTSREATRHLPRGHASRSARRCRAFHEAVHGLAPSAAWPCARSSITSRRSMRRLMGVVGFGRVRDAWTHRSRRGHAREAVGRSASGRAFAPVGACEPSAGSVRGLAPGQACARVRPETSSPSLPRSHRGTRRHAPQGSSRCTAVIATSYRGVHRGVPRYSSTSTANPSTMYPWVPRRSPRCQPACTAVFVNEHPGDRREVPGCSSTTTRVIAADHRVSRRGVPRCTSLCIGDIVDQHRGATQNALGTSSASTVVLTDMRRGDRRHTPR